MMSFRETLDRHLSAVQRRDLEAFAATVADDAVLVVQGGGRLVLAPSEFLRAHREWFAAKNWTIDVTPVDIRESADMGFALLHLRYAEHREGAGSLEQESYLTLVFERRGGRWVMVLDQNTPARPDEAAG